MQFQEKLIKGKKYKYAVKSIRMPNGKVVSLQKIFKGENNKELERIFLKKEIEAHFKYVVNTCRPDHIVSLDMLEKIETIKIEYRRILKKMPPQTLKDMWDRFTANFTYESNALEGNSLTLKDVAIVMFENATIKGKDLREIYETRNSRKVVELIVNNKFTVTEKDIIKMHKILVKDIGISTGYKKFPNIILGKKIKTTPPEGVPQEMAKLIAWYNKNQEDMHPIKLAALFHGRFEQIHPFEDGNGRVGRFLINVILVNHKYPPLIIRKSQRLAYIKALENFDAKHTDTLYRLILEKCRDTYKKFFEIYVKYI